MVLSQFVLDLIMSKLYIFRRWNGELIVRFQE